MRNEFTLSEMANISIPASRKDPLNFHQLPDFYYFSRKTLKKTQEEDLLNETPSEIRPVSSNHYIENRFCAYEKAKIFNRPLFSQISKSAKGEKRIVSNSRFCTSRFPNVPLGEEVVKKVENINSFRDINKKNSRNVSPMKNSANFLKKNSFKTIGIVENLRSWEKVKREKNTSSQRQTGRMTAVSRPEPALGKWERRNNRKDFGNTYDSFSSDFVHIEQYYL
jgi:hypothetical protein